MPFSAQELQNIANAAFDYHLKGPAIAQAIQEKPLMEALDRRKKFFPGGKGDIRLNVKGTYTTGLAGYSHDEQVSYQNPANIKQAEFPWKELHAGITVTETELKHDGISITDEFGESTEEHSDRDLHVITNLLQDKLDDMTEGWAKSFNQMLWQDGSQDTQQVPGVMSLITDDPTTGIVAGIDRATNSWYRNRARTTESGGVITHSTSSQTLTKTLRSEVRQLRRYGGRPSLILCGSGFVEKLEAEVHEKGTYTQAGFVNKGKTDIGMSVISMYGVGDFIYDPTLDDLSRSNYAYFIDPRNLCLMPMQGEDMKKRAPARPHDRYVIYRAVTWTGGLVMKMANCHGVYQAA
jgi:hypothetical protein